MFSHNSISLKTAALSLLLISSTLSAASDNQNSNPEAPATENNAEECYCDVRKRQQVERRLQKKNQLEQE